MTYQFKQNFKQFDICCKLLAIYLIFIHGPILPYINEIYLTIIPYGALEEFGYTHYFPSLFHISRAPLFMTVSFYMILLSSIFIFFNFKRRLFCFLAWYLMASFYSLNPFTLSPELPYIGWLVLACSLIDSPTRKEEQLDWSMSPIIYYGGFVVLAVSYFYGGQTKLTNPHWVDGSALLKIASESNITYQWLKELLPVIPTSVFTLSTWLVVFSQCTAPLFFVRSQWRFFAWTFLFLNHVVVLFLFRIPDVSLGMMLFHIFLFDLSWLESGRRENRRLFT